MTTKLIITYWRDIPSQIEAQKSRRERSKIMLSDRFMIAIDKAAMKAKLFEGDDYLKEWRKGKPSSSPLDDLEKAAQQLADTLENLFSDEIIAILVQNGGYSS